MSRRNFVLNWNPWTIQWDVEPDAQRITGLNVHVREVLAGDEDLFDTQVRLAELSKQHAKLVSAARAVVEFHNAVELRSAIKSLKSVLDESTD